MSADDTLREIRAVLDSYERILNQVKRLGRIPLSGPERDQIIKPREDLKAKFIKLKNAGRAIINTMMPLRVAEQKARELTDLQTRFRLLNEEFKAFREEDTSLGIEQDRRLLLQGAAERKADAIPTASSNDSFLQQGRSIAQDTTLKLRTAMGDLRQADEMGKAALITLVEDQESMGKVMSNLEIIESDLALSRKLIASFVKRLYTDKIILIFTCLVVCAIVAIIVFAALKAHSAAGGSLGPDTMSSPSASPEARPSNHPSFPSSGPEPSSHSFPSHEPTPLWSL